MPQQLILCFCVEIAAEQHAEMADTQLHNDGVAVLGYALVTEPEQRVAV